MKPLLNTILRCSLGFVLLMFGILLHAQLFVILAAVNFALAGVWLWIDSQKEETQ